MLQSAIAAGCASTAAVPMALEYPMLRLTLLRHASSEPGQPDQQDWDRKLEARGVQDVCTMAHRLRHRQLLPERILTSPAVRARRTAELLARELALHESTVTSDERLYLASPHVMLEVVREVGGTCAHLLLVGHNPGITEFADQLSRDRTLDNMPTCGLYTLQFDVKQWTALDWRRGTDADFDYPRSY